jgi:hypothetical protein
MGNPQIIRDAALAVKSGESVVSVEAMVLGSAFDARARVPFARLSRNSFRNSLYWNELEVEGSGLFL